jgi:hypothetical protein
MMCRKDRDGSDRPTRGPVASPTSRDLTRHDPGRQSLDAPAPGDLSSADPGVVTLADGDQQRGKAQRLQPTEDEEPRAATSTVHTDLTGKRHAHRLLDMITKPLTPRH